MLSYILGGWQVNNMISIMSGPPFSVFADDTSLNLPGSVQTADQVKDAQKLGGVGQRHALLRSDGVCRGDRGAFRQHRLQHPARAGPVQLGLRLDARVRGDAATSSCSSAWRRSTSRTRRISAIPDNNVGDGSDFMTITSVQDLAREGIDERQFRLGVRIVF